MLPSGKFQTVQSDGAAIAFRDFGGDGPPLLFLHGNGEDWRCFEQQYPVFCPRFRVIAIDSRGHGDSEPGAAPLTLTQMARDAAAVLDALDIPRAAVIGFSDGGNVALYLALAFPKRVAALVLAGANLSPKGVKARYQLPIVVGYHLCALCARFRPDANRNLQILDLMVHQPQIEAGRLKDIAVPTLVLAGERDMIKTSHTRQIAAAIPGARLRIISETDHFVFSKSPQTTNREILAFLEQIPAPNG